jgi:hypothetical protein
MTFFTSKEMKAILKLTDCELMHLREANKFEFKKKGNAFLYSLPSGKTLLDHPLGLQLLNWHKGKHQCDVKNEPENVKSNKALEQLIKELLLPIERKFGKLEITYGFTSAALKSYIAKYTPKGTAPDLDQHAACELNSKSTDICKRGGAACDIILENTSMASVTRYIVKHLNYDRIYYYGDRRPLHISVGLNPVKHLQVMKDSESGRRYPSAKAYGKEAANLAETL